MEYTFSAYFSLINNLTKHGYLPVTFADTPDISKRLAILRHDVDVDPVIAAKFGMLEEENGIRSTYFVMLGSSYYNLFTKTNRNAIEKILECNHEIGLHFDITNYDDDSIDHIMNNVFNEKTMLETVFDISIKSISWHIPKKELIGKHLPQLDDLGLLNAYDPKYYYGYKYVSDSMMQWREPIEQYINNEQFEKLQILTHPVWYKERQNETDIQILVDSAKHKHIENEEYLETIRPGYIEEVKLLNEEF